MKFKLLTPQKPIVEKEVESVTLPGALGQITALSGHDIMFTKLNSGLLYYRTKDNPAARTDFQIGEGFVEITKEGVSVFASSVKGQ